MSSLRRNPLESSGGPDVRSGPDRSTEFLDRFEPHCLDHIREAIASAAGQEVFILGSRPEDGPIQAVRVLARGHESAAPAILTAGASGDVVIHNHPSGVLRPSEADLDVAGHFAERAIGFYIVDNLVLNLYVVVEPFSEAHLGEVSCEEVAETLGKEGGLSSAHPSYEHRPQQIAMAREVAQALNQDGILLAEAGTGTGKSMAYLLPGVLWALSSKQRVLVSTHTIHLQQQLVDQDIPLLRKALGRPFRAELVKGRSNYVCRRKAAAAAEQLKTRLLDDGLSSELRDLLDWVETSETGSRQDLPFQPSPDVWDHVVSEADTTLRTRCPHYHKCFFYSARRRAAAAQVLVANHHLLFSDLSVRASTGNFTTAAVLPPYQRVFIDEAHHVEDVATEHFGGQTTRRGLLYMLGRLHRKKGSRPDGSGGLLKLLLGALAQRKGQASSGLTAIIQGQILPAWTETVRVIEEAFTSIHDTVRQSDGLSLDEGSSERRRVSRLRLTPALEEGDGWYKGVVQPVSDMVAALRSLAHRVARLAEDLQALEEEPPGTLTDARLKLAAAASRLLGAALSAEQVLQEDPTGKSPRVRWIEAVPGHQGRPAQVRLAWAPLQVGPDLAESLYRRFKTVLLTSATLAANDGFSYTRSRLGLDVVPPERMRELLVQSPFDHRRQSLLAVPRDLPDPGEPRFTEILPEILLDAVSASKGAAFLLFTSYKLLSLCHDRMASRLQTAGFSVLRQGSDSRARLLDRFRSESGSVLFGTDSFWEGVDVPGEALVLVAITRLPFRVPTEPLVQARYEACQAGGRNPFREYSLPQAILKLKQGFGRLIRTRTDRGAVLLLDPRVITKSYGRAFLESLPPARRIVGPLNHVMDELALFFSPEKPQPGGARTKSLAQRRKERKGRKEEGSLQAGTTPGARWRGSRA